jgi:hypothetical protein
LPSIPEDDDEYISIDVFNRAINQLEGMNATPEILRTIADVAAKLDRAMERRANRKADVQRIEVVFTHDWRQEG